MNLNWILLLCLLFICFHYSEQNKLRFKSVGSSTDQKHGLLCFWNQTKEWTHPYQTITVECCDEELQGLILQTIKDAGMVNSLGDLAKFIQRKAQLNYHMSFETIVSEKNFAISSHYHGTHTCKIHRNHHYILIYETPVQYDPFDLRTEDYLSSIDSSDPLGSQKPANLRGDFPDIREDSTAGEDLSVQPPIDSILKYPNKFAWPDPDEKVSKRIQLAEAEALRSMNELLESVTEISVLNAGNRTEGVNVTEIELPNPSPIPRKFANLREKDRLPANTHCDKKRKDGHKCCDGKLASTMRDAMRQMATSPDFGKGTENVIAAELQQKVQSRFKKSFEVIVSRSDFVVFTRAGSNSFCKFENRDFYILAYSTPKQYDIDEKEDETELAAKSDKEPLGVSAKGKHNFDNESPWQIPLKLKESGERAGYPVGSHCSSARTGSKCCSLILFNAMKTGYDNHVVSSNFDPYDIRNISKAVQWNVEEVLQHSAEVIVSLDDFVYVSHNNNSYTCKYRVDKYHILAYTTPNNFLDDDEMSNNDVSSEPEAQLVFPVVDPASSRHRIPYQNTPVPSWTTPVPIPTQMFQPRQFTFQPLPFQQPGFPINQLNLPRGKRQIGATPYPIHQNTYNDIGSAKSFNCPAALSGLSGMACCDGGLQYEASKVLDQAKQNTDFDKHDTKTLAKLMTRAVQKRFGTTFESIVAEADFSWGTNKFNGRTCKFDSEGYTALTYQSSSKPPPASDFIDIPNDPTLGGPSGSSGSNSGGAGGAASAARGGGAANGAAAGNGQGAASTGNGALGNGQVAPLVNQNGIIGNAQNTLFSQNGVIDDGTVFLGQNQVIGNEETVFFGRAGVEEEAIAWIDGPEQFVWVPNEPAAPAAVPYQDVAAAGGSNNLLASVLGDGSCFSVDTWVTTPSGKKRMDELEIGDYVLTADSVKSFFTPITLWIHREPEKVEKFVTVMTEFGKMLRLTSRHFMYRNKCGSKYKQYIKQLPEDSEVIFAEHLVVGDCLIVLYRGKWRQQRILEITETTRTGIYSPLTSNGRIIVNDILASCYSEVHQNTLQTTFFWAFDKLRTKLIQYFGYQYNDEIQLPTVTSFTREIMNLVLPLK